MVAAELIANTYSIFGLPYIPGKRSFFSLRDETGATPLVEKLAEDLPFD